MESVLWFSRKKKNLIKILAMCFTSVCFLGSFSNNTYITYATYDEITQAKPKIASENYLRQYNETELVATQNDTYLESYLDYLSKNKSQGNEEKKSDEPLDTDPLSSDKFHEEYVNSLDLLPMDLNELISKYSTYFDHPGTNFYFREKRNVSPDDYAIIENIVLGEVSFCSFEQMVAEASLCINIMEQEDTNMYDLVMRPGVFLPDYAEKTMESTEEVTAAIEAAIFGIDFSLGATSACTYEWMDEYYKKWFDTLYLTTKIEDSSFYCDPEKIIDESIYYYSEELGQAINVK